MAEIMDDIVHLSQEIGPHPTGTEEEQQAALYLAEEIQKESGFTSVIEDFQCVTNYLICMLWISFGCGYCFNRVANSGNSLLHCCCISGSIVWFRSI